MSQSRPAALIIGDVMLDRRVEGEMVRVSPEAPAPIIRQETVTESPGGAANVARNIVSLGAKAYLMGVIGNDYAGQTLAKMIAEAGVTACLPVGGATTIQKTRITCGGQIVLRTDMEQTPLSATEELCAGLKFALEGSLPVGIIVIADYGKGTVTQELFTHVRALAAAQQIPIYVDCRPAQVMQYEGVTLIKPNLKEALGMMDVLRQVHPGLYPADPVEQGNTAAVLLRQALQVTWPVVTLGKDGCVWFDPTDETYHTFQPRAKEVYDVCGAGDTTMAALAVAYLEGKSPDIAVSFAMYAAGLAVRRHGVHAIHRDEVEEFRYRETGWPAKLMDEDQLRWFVDRRRRRGDRLVFTNGCFDGLHSGHIEMFRFAKQQGDTLIVAYNDDDSLRSLKGTNRPHVPQSYRASHLAQQASVDAVYRFDGDAEKLIRTLKPDVLVKGEDSASQVIPGAEFVASHGGIVALAPIKFNLSSSLAGGGDKLVGPAVGS